jgi:hypothetical protein
MNSILNSKFLSVLVLLFSLSGCALKPHLVTLFNLDTHQINFKDTTGDFRAERTMMAEALKYCDSLDKHFIPVELSKSFLSNTYTLTFRCLDPESPELQNQNKKNNINKENNESGDFLSSYRFNIPQS